MDDKNLRAFYYVHKFGSFKKAADHFCTPLPSISRRVKALETELGVKLLNRSNKGEGITLSEEGRNIIEYAGNILSQVDNIQRELRSDFNTIRISSSPNMASDFIAPSIKGLKHNFNIEIITQKTDSPCDLYIGSQKSPHFHLLDSQKIFFNLYASSEYISTNPLRLPPEKHKYIVYKTDPKDFYGETNIINFLKENDYINNNIIFVDSGQTELQLVKNGLGIGLLSDAYLKAPDSNLCKIELIGFKSIPLYIYFYIVNKNIDVEKVKFCKLLTENIISFTRALS